MLKGGVIMDVTTPEQARIAEGCRCLCSNGFGAHSCRYSLAAGGGVSRISDPKMIRGIQEAVSIPVMAKVRIGHFVKLRFYKPSKSTI